MDPKVVVKRLDKLAERMILPDYRMTGDDLQTLAAARAIVRHVALA